MAYGITIDSFARQDDSLVLRVTTPNKAETGGDITPVAHTIIVPLAAIANRQRVYGLATPRAALGAILKEHVKRLNTLPDGDEQAGAAPIPLARVRDMGGLRADVTVAIDATPAAALTAAGIE